LVLSEKLETSNNRAGGGETNRVFGCGGGAGEGQGVGVVEGEGAAVGDIALDAARGAAVAELQGAGGNRGTAVAANAATQPAKKLFRPKQTSARRTADRPLSLGEETFNRATGTSDAPISALT
jgi:hypothetical protein